MDEGFTRVERSEMREIKEIRVNSSNYCFKLCNVFLLSSRVVLQGVVVCDAGPGCCAFTKVTRTLKQISNSDCAKGAKRLL